MSPTKFRSLIPTLSVALMLSVGWSSHALALTKERWTDETPAGAFFNNYEPNFYTGFAPRVQDRRYVTIHTGRGNQVRLRIVLPEEAIETYLPEQTARHALFKEVIDKDIIELAANSAWETYDARVTEIGLADLAARRDAANPEEWRQLNLDMMDQLSPGRLYRIQRDFDAMASELTTALSEVLGEAETIDKLEAKLDLINAMMPGRIKLTDLSDEQSAAFDELTALAKSRDTAAFRAALEPFFQDITGGIYEIADGKLDFFRVHDHLSGRYL